MKKDSISSIFWNVLILCFTLVMILPVFWMITTSLKSSSEMFASGFRLFPKNPTLIHFHTLITRFDIPKIVANTFIMAVGLSALQIFTSLLAAYGFARYSFPGSRILFYLCIAQMFIPIQVVMVSNYLVVTRLGLMNTLLAVVLPQTSLGLGIFFIDRKSVV